MAEIEYDSKQKRLIHHLMEAVFSGEALNRFCAEYYASLCDAFTLETSTAEKIRTLIEHSATNNQLGKLLANIQQADPESYQAFVEQVQTPARKSGPTSPSTALAKSSSSSPVRRVGSLEDLLGQSLEGRYRIERLIDQGGTGNVYKAFDTKLELEVAIKIFDLNRVQSAAIQERFRQEARTAMKLDHPGIVQVYDFGQIDNLLYIIKEFIPGYNLHEVRHQYFKSIANDLILSQTTELMRQLCLTVDYMHQQGVLHPSLRPQTIMLKPSSENENLGWQPVLVNLGLMRPHREALMSREEFPLEQLIYMVSPELLLGHVTDIRSDVYALGVVMYELYVGQPPFQPVSLTDALRLHVEESPPPPRSLNPEIPETIEQVILQALAKDPAERFLSAKGMAQALAGGQEWSGSALALRLKGESELRVTMEEHQLVVIPGENVTIMVGLHNEGGQEEHCRLRVEGLPAEWVTLSTSTLTLPPGEREDVALTLAPPLGPESRAGRHSFTTQVINQRDSTRFEELKRVLTVAAYHQFNSSLWPQEILANQVTQATVENRGNSPETFTIRPKSDKKLSFEPKQAQFKLEPGESKTADFKVSPASRWIGEPLKQTFSVRISSAQGQLAVLSGEVTSRAALRPRWVLAALVAVALLICTVAAFFPLLYPSEQAVRATADLLTATVRVATSQAAANQTAVVATATGQVEATRQAATRLAEATATSVVEDTDGDGLANSEESALGTDPGNQDSDGDSLFDGAEVRQFGTDPRNPDSDFDGVPDGEEIRLNLDPLSRDTDLDGTPDLIDADPGRVPTATPSVTPNATATRTPGLRFNNIDFTVRENEEEAAIAVVMELPVEGQVQVNCTTQPGTATAGEDYRTVNQVLVFDPGQTVQTCTVPIENDDIDEPDETVNLLLTDVQGGSLGANSQATLNIIDDDSVKVRFTKQDGSFGSTLSRLPRFEESESTSSALIQVELSAPSSEPVSVSYATSNVDALAGEDYISAGGTLTFEPGQLQRIFTVSIIDDSLPEADEVLILNLSNAVGATIETPDAQLVIRDND